MGDQTNTGQGSDEKLGKSELLSKIQASREALEMAIQGLSDEQMTGVSSSGWSIKDHMAHLAIWERGIVALLQRQSRPEAMGLDGSSFGEFSTDEINDRVQRQHAGLDLPAVLRLFDETHHSMLDVLGVLTEDDLYRPYASYVLDSRDERQDPVINWIIGNTYEHFDEHLEYIGQIIAEGEHG